MNRITAAAAVKHAAIELGFTAVGIAEAVPLIEPMKRYDEWLQRGYHGMMGYMERNLDSREDVSAIVPNARSVIVVALNYYHDVQHEVQHEVHHEVHHEVQHEVEPRGKISRYAWGDDYHSVIPPRLDALIERMNEIIPGAASKRYTDTGPVLEKEWAVRAGIGWQGKHSNVLRRDIGSWFFLGVIITDADLAPDEPMMDYCGTCTACIDACPTSAIVDPYVVDGSKCLSYWTIEVKPQHEIPAEIAENMDGWLFGCDVCQDVCPWNRFQQQSTEERFAPRCGETAFLPSSIVNLSQEEYKERFRDSPLLRPKHAGLQRNARAIVNGADLRTKEHE